MNPLRDIPRPSCPGLGVYLEVHQAMAYAGKPIQVCIGVRTKDGYGHGYRICGPEFSSSGSKLLREKALDEHDIKEIRAYLRQASRILKRSRR